MTLVTHRVSTNNPQGRAWWWEPKQSAALGTGVQGRGAVTQAWRPALQHPGVAESRSEGMRAVEPLKLIREQRTESQVRAAVGLAVSNREWQGT